MNKETEEYIEDYKKSRRLSGSVDVIASGYEWICPGCEHYHRMIEIKEEVTCENCGNQYETEPPEHAIG